MHVDGTALYITVQEMRTMTPEQEVWLQDQIRARHTSAQLAMAINAMYDLAHSITETAVMPERTIKDAK